jgi:hypothetical protein
MTAPKAPASPEQTGYGWCAWHEGNARGVRLISIAEQGSGPGTTARRFACRSCVYAYDLAPFADRP